MPNTLRSGFLAEAIPVSANRHGHAQESGFLTIVTPVPITGSMRTLSHMSLSPGSWLLLPYRCPVFAHKIHIMKLTPSLPRAKELIAVPTSSPPAIHGEHEEGPFSQPACLCRRAHG